MMKKQLLLSTLTLGVTSNIAIGMEIQRKFSDESEFEKFTQKFAPPIHIQKIIEDHKDIDYGIIRDKNDAPVVYAKRNDFARIINADRMDRCIKENKFTTIAVPKKWVYQVDGEWKVYAEYIQPGKARKYLTTKETQELVRLAEQTGFRDWYTNIIINQSNGKITIIDTENNSFLVVGGYRLKDFPQHCKLQYIVSLSGYKKLMDNRTKEWFTKRIDYLSNNPNAITENQPLPLPLSEQFNNPEFNLEKLKKELEEKLVH